MARVGYGVVIDVVVDVSEGESVGARVGGVRDVCGGSRMSDEQLVWVREGVQAQKARLGT